MKVGKEKLAADSLRWLKEIFPFSFFFSCTGQLKTTRRIFVGFCSKSLYITRPY